VDNSGALLFAFRPLPAIALAQARRAGLSGKQKKKLCVLRGSAVKEGGDVKWCALTG
jgi:hypothetical protein